ncbi:hypothetical protein [Candidatus Clostridium helianthi]|jgi:hypothetical protein|uniref:N-acetyltransferase domain-containing protein n=1 Tax=Candidatus Clostridium helianthi TaxID=3381660 RepID=A0ABW8S0Z2_9CLOT
MDKLEYLNDLKRHYIILGEEKNKVRECLFACAIKDKDEYTLIALKSIDNQRDISKLNIITERYPNDIDKKIIKIADIIISNKNRGNGSILMKYLFEYVNQNSDIKKIIGTISEVDQDHFDRLEHFYKKHGFKVAFYTNDKGERIAGDIEKEL